MIPLAERARRLLGIVELDDPFNYEASENLGTFQTIKQGQAGKLIASQLPSTSPGRQITWSLIHQRDPKFPPLPTDDLSGFFYLLTYGVGGTTGCDKPIEIDAGNGLFIAAPAFTYSLAGVYGAPTPTQANPNPTTPDIVVRALMGFGTRPSGPISPTRTRRFPLTNAGVSSVQSIPVLARSLHVLGTQTSYSVTFFTDEQGTSPLLTLPTVGGILADIVSVPAGAQSFKVGTAGPAEPTVMAVFQLAL